MGRAVIKGMRQKCFILSIGDESGTSCQTGMTKKLKLEDDRNVIEKSAR